MSESIFIFTYFSSFICLFLASCWLISKIIPWLIGKITSWLRIKYKIHINKDLNKDYKIGKIFLSILALIALKFFFFDFWNHIISNLNNVKSRQELNILVSFFVLFACFVLFLCWLIMQIIFLFSPKSSPNIKHKIPVNKNCKYGKISLFILLLTTILTKILFSSSISYFWEGIVFIAVPILLFINLIFLVLSFLKDNKKIYFFISILITLLVCFYISIMIMALGSLGRS